MPKKKRSQSFSIAPASRFGCFTPPIASGDANSQCELNDPDPDAASASQIFVPSSSISVALQPSAATPASILVPPRVDDAASFHPLTSSVCSSAGLLGKAPPGSAVGVAASTVTSSIAPSPPIIASAPAAPTALAPSQTEQIGTEKQLDQPLYEHIERNEFSYRKHVEQNEEDIAICICQYDASSPDSACGDRCLNVLTSTECTPGYCPCDNHCMNQKFQKCEYAKLQLFKTDGRGWGVLADENIKAGQFLIEYCGEVISSNEAKQRAEAYEAEGVKDAYIISLNAQESIDATKKGSLARFINHSCEPNCETRKWTVLGEIRVGIFAKQDIQLGAELSYDYKFEWFGGAKVRCLCGAACCSEYLGAKSRGFMAANDDWGDNSDSISVEDISIYYSDDDEPTSQLLPEDDAAKKGELNKKSENKHKQTSSAGQISSMSRSLMPYTNGKRKTHTRKCLSAKEINERLWLKEARDELLAYEALMNESKLKHESINQEIKPFVEKHDRDAQNKVPTSVAESWLDAHCNQMATEFDFLSSVIENVICNPKKPKDDAMSNGEAGDGVNPLDNDE